MFTWILISVLLILNLCLWTGNICNGLLLGNASIARGPNMVQKTCKTLGLKKIMVYKIPLVGGGGKPYLATGLLLWTDSVKQSLRFSNFGCCISKWYLSRLLIHYMIISKSSKQFKIYVKGLNNYYPHVLDSIAMLWQFWFKVNCLPNRFHTWLISGWMGE